MSSTVRTLPGFVGTAVFVFCALFVAPTTATAQDGLIVRQLKFEGNESIDAPTLAAAIATTNSSWFARTPLIRLIGLGEKRRLNQRDLERDVERLRILYRAYGFMQATVDTVVRRTTENAFITFRITEGQPILLTRFNIFGIDSLPRPDRLVRDLPLREGEPPNRLLLQATGDTITNRLQDGGYPDARVFLEHRAIDTTRRSAEIELRVDAGEQRVIGDIVVEGFRPGDSSFVTRLMAARPGNLFRTSELLRSQRNIVNTEAYRFAAVEIDTARYTGESDSVPLRVRLIPGASHRVGASIGYGTDDCFRATADWTFRNLLRGGRLLRLATRVSKVGTGEPLDWGLEDRLLCGQLADDPIGSSKLNYSVTANFTQPAFLSPDNSLTLQFFSERRSEFAVYLREEAGGGITLTREGASRIQLNTGYRLAWGSTEATDANFCAYFNACNPADIAVLTARQRQGVVTGGLSRLRVNNLLDPSRGTSMGLQVAHSGTYTGSEPLQRFTRIIGDVSVYQPLTASIIGAFRLRGGVVFSPATVSDGVEFNYEPPEQRFYAGGANDVRGYNRNDLGPVVYVVLDSTRVPDEGEVDPDDVTVSPIGGNRLLIANAEVRIPSPIFPTRWRVVAFVDGGAVMSDLPDQPASFDFRVTPGMGLRIGTPLGPARLDVAYRGYGYPPGTLYFTQSDGSLVAAATDYVKPIKPGFTVHIAIGQAF